MDIFSQFELEDEKEKEELKWITTNEYKPEWHCHGWFMWDEQKEIIDKKELLYMKVAYLRREGKYKEALEVLLSLRDSFEHKGSFRFMVDDAIVNTALEVDCTTLPSLLSFLHSLKSSMTNYGDQIQCLDVSTKVFSLSSSYSSFLLRSLILLSQLLDLPEHWIAMADISHDEIGVNWRIGCRVKSLLLMDSQSEMAKGFIKEKMRRKSIKLREELENEELFCVALEHVGCDKESWKKEEKEEKERPVHLCRSEGRMMNEEEEKTTIHSFYIQYPWITEGMQSVLETILYPF